MISSFQARTEERTMKNRRVAGSPYGVSLICSLALLALVPVACTQSSMTSLSISLDKEALSVAPGGAGTVMVEVTRDGGFSGEVSLAVIGLPAGLGHEWLGDPSEGQ